MNAIHLQKPDGTITDWSMCSECHMVAGRGNFDISEKCCTCYHCGGPLPKDQRVPYATGKGKALYHRECERNRRMARVAEVLENAELVTDYDGPVYAEGVGNGSFGEGFFSDVQELSEHLDFHEGARPLFAHCCKSRGFSIDIDSILETATEEMYDDITDDLSGLAELQSAVDDFNKANESIITWDPDYKRKVAIPESPVAKPCPGLDNSGDA